MIDFDKLIETSHAIAVEHGWWDGGERSLDDQFNNFDAEIIEAWEEYRAGRPLDEIWYRCQRCDNVFYPDSNSDDFGAKGGRCICDARLKPEGFTVELADLLIRIADTMGAYGWAWNSVSRRYDDVKHAIDLQIPSISTSNFIRRIRRTLEGEPSEQACLRWVILYVLAFCKHHNLPLERALEEKTACNRTRPYRHGNKLA